MTFEPRLHIHVAPDGDDFGPGTTARPFATLRRAQSAVRERTGEMDRDIIVNLHGGEHAIEEPLRLSAEAGDSGANGHRVIYEARGWGTLVQEEVLISGGRRITGWMLYDDQRGIWRADVQHLATRQLFVAGRRMVRARRAGGRPLGIAGTVRETEEGYVTDSLEPQSWENPEEIEFVYRGHGGFSEPRCGVAEITGDSRSTTIVMDQPAYRWFRQNHRGQWGDGPRGFGTRIAFEPPAPLWIENSRTFLTEPGTFYLDRSDPGNHSLYLIPPPGEDLETAEVMAPVLERLVECVGESGSPLRDVTFRGITFAHATWMGPGEPTGFSQVYGPIYEGGDTDHFDDPWDSSDAARSVSGNVRFRHVEGVIVEDCRFEHLGADALELSMGSSHNVVRGNLFGDISGGAVQVGARQPDTDLDRFNRGNTIENNVVRNVGVEYRGSIGIYAEKTQGARIAHNQVSDVPYTGISFGEYWTHYPDGETTAAENSIVANRIFRAMQSMHDGGGIFTASRQGTSYDDGSIVSRNVIHDLAPVPVPTRADGGAAGRTPAEIGEDTVIALYADDDADWVTWSENIVFRVRGTTISGCPLRNRFVNNFFEATTGPSFWCTRGGVHVVYEDNAILDDDPERQCAEHPIAEGVLAGAGPEPAYRAMVEG